MTELIGPDLWGSLRDRSTGEEILAEELLLDGERTNCFAAIDGATRLHLMVAVVDSDVQLPPDLHGVIVRYVDVDRTYIDISVQPKLELFVTPIFNQIVLSIFRDGRHPVFVVTEQLELLRKAFSRVGSEISEVKQIGLFGELWALLNIVIPAIGNAAVSRWSGPLFERHDFVGDKAHIEVKSTTKSEDKHEISRIDQLRPPNGKDLMLVSIQLERSIGGDDTLATMREKIIESLKDDGPAIEEFEEKMISMGWNAGLVQSGTLLKFNVRSVFAFLVDDTFPRLPDDYVPPRGVTAIQYTINISACSVLSLADTMRTAKSMCV